MREYEKSQGKALRDAEQEISIERYGPFAVWIPHARWVAAILTIVLIIWDGTDGLAADEYTDWLGIVLKSLFFGALAYGVTGAALRALLRKPR